jgi:hypothetical protein
VGAASAPSGIQPSFGAGQSVVLVTGSTDGLGREVARRLAVGGAHAIVHGRNRERGEALVREIEIAGNGSAPFYAADLASLAEVRSFAAATAPAISILCSPPPITTLPIVHIAGKRIGARASGSPQGGARGGLISLRPPHSGNVMPGRDPSRTCGTAASYRSFAASIRRFATTP